MHAEIKIAQFEKLRGQDLCSPILKKREEVFFLANSAPSQRKPYSIYHLSLTREGLLSLLNINMLIINNFLS